VKTLLLLEDEPMVMRVLRLMLKQFSVIEATTAEKALQAFGDHDHPVDLLITDVRLPTLSGIHVALRIRSELPEFPVLLMSGYPAGGWRGTDAVDLERLGTDSVALLQKPFPAKALLSAVYDLIGKPYSDIAKTA
jgi:two-component system, cell cycle sensor histidine kinase and response regulator CckA